MRTNFFIGVEGTHSLIRNALELGTNTGPFKTFMGPLARSMFDEDHSTIINSLFADELLQGSFDECNIGMTRISAAGTMFNAMLDKAPSGSRVWFFKSPDNFETVELYSSFLKVAREKNIVQRLTGVDETNVVNMYAEVTNRALIKLDAIATMFGASEWDNFDLNIFNGSPRVSPVEVRLYTKP
jgi:hypothetical protein